jgi:hypothetical protein
MTGLLYLECVNVQYYMYTTFMYCWLCYSRQTQLNCDSYSVTLHMRLLFQKLELYVLINVDKSGILHVHLFKSFGRLLYISYKAKLLYFLIV